LKEKQLNNEAEHHAKVGLGRIVVSETEVQHI
jgi:hypothetical protein